MIQKIISGGQTGVDRASLDAAARLGYQIGGYVPKGRKSEDGPIPDCYPMIELDSPDYVVRTQRNIAAAGATVILIQREADMRGGTWRTFKEVKKVAEKNDQLYAIFDITHNSAPLNFRAFWDSMFREGEVSVVNFAGPRESKSPGIYRLTYEFLMRPTDECRQV